MKRAASAPSQASPWGELKVELSAGASTQLALPVPATVVTMQAAGEAEGGGEGVMVGVKEREAEAEGEAPGVREGVGEGVGLCVGHTTTLI